MKGQISMDTSTHEIRLAGWKTIVEQCTARPEGQTIKQWLALNGITAFSVKPLYVIFNIGLLFLIIALIIGLYVAYSLIVGTAVQGWASLMLSIWLVGGFVLTSLGVIGTYIGKIYTEVKQRPLYHIQEILD